MVHVYFYIPNLIGYARVILSIASFAVFFDDPVLFSLFYMSSFLLDAADGLAARQFNQCSKFGAVLDMVTDRFSTAAFVMLLSHLEPYNTFLPRLLLVLLNVLDLTAHWFQMYASLSSGAQSHKVAANPLLRIYYSSRTVLSIVCLGQEVFYFLMYVAVFEKQLGLTNFHSAIGLAMRIAFPVFAFKQLLNFLQLHEACGKIVALDEKTPNLPPPKGRAKSEMSK